MSFNPDILDTLTVANMKHNYPQFVDYYGYDRADERMEACYGDAWVKHRENIWQWFDQDYQEAVL